MIQGMPRREFLKLFGAGVLTAEVLTYLGPGRDLFGLENILRPQALSLASIKVGGKDEHLRISALGKIISLLETEGSIDLILTPEYTFYKYHREEEAYDELILREINGGYEVDSSSHAINKLCVKHAQELAARYRSNIFLGTFPEVDQKDGKMYNTLLYINREGKIMARKRKFYPLEDEFVITANNGKSYRVLPLICGESGQDRTPEGVDIPPEWVGEMVNKYGRFDIMTHSLQQRDVDFENLAKVVVQGILTKEQLHEQEPYRQDIDDYLEWLEDAFHHYYNGYINVIKQDAPIVISDANLAAVLNLELKPFENYTATEDYTLVRV